MVDHVPQPCRSDMMDSLTIQKPAPLTADTAAPDFVVVDVETACSRVSSICQIGIVGYRDGVGFGHDALYVATASRQSPPTPPVRLE